MKNILDHINNHRSIRNYNDRKIDNQLLNRLLEAACRASNTGNMQPYSVVVNTSDEMKEKLSPLHFNQPMVKNAAAVLSFCADFNRISKWCELRQATPGFDNFQSFITAAIDALLLSQNFCVAAESQGLGVCYLGTTTYNAEEISNVLQLPKLVVPVASVAVGYPADTPSQTDRLPLAAIVHSESYRDYGAQDIDALYEEKEKSEFYRQFVAENGKETLAQVFTDVRYTKKNSEFFSDKFLSFLKKQGFLS